VIRRLVICGGALTALLVTACGSATNAATTPTATAVPSTAPTATPTPTPTATPAPTAAPTPTPAPGAAVMLRSVGGLGQILVGPNGRTLYLFMGDTGMTSRCTGSCAQNWPPLTTAGVPRAVGGVSQHLLGTTRRADGTTQVTYNGHPLYYFIADTGPGHGRRRGNQRFWRPLGSGECGRSCDGQVSVARLSAAPKAHCQPDP
jgi:predicted lipoprotein with Yx(FWY)xxD motif